MKRMILAVCAVLALTAVPVATAEWGNPETITVDQPAPAAGDTITFTLANLDASFPYTVNLACYQGGNLVFHDWHNLPAGSSDSGGFTLAWSGAARCQAYLYRETEAGGLRVGSTKFKVAA